ncbi:unnamed protein product [Rhizopus stolonifer]
MNTTDYADYEDYKHFYKGGEEIPSYFSNNPASSWSFELFFDSINKNKRRSTKRSSLLKLYLNQLNMINQDPKTPQEAKKTNEETTKFVNYNITGNTSVSISDNTSIINSHVKDVQKEEKKKGNSEEKEYVDEFIHEEDVDEYISEEDGDDNVNIPSDLTIDHHPSRECEYFFDQERVLGETNEHGEIAQDEWFIELKKSPGSLSDIRLLAMNDIFIFDTDVNISASKYFRLEDHNAIIPSLNFKKHRPETGIKAHQWCQEIVDVNDTLKN